MLTNLSVTWKKRLAWAFGIAALASLAYLIVVPRPVAVETALVTRGEFREVILSDGILRSRERYTVPAFADGDIKRMPLKVGDNVKRGQVLTELFWDVKFEGLRAPMSGVISKVFRESAGPIRRGEPIVEIIDPAQLEVMAELLTTDAMRLRPGAPVEVLGWPGAGKLTGKVSRISKAGFVKPSALGVEEERTEVTASLPALPPEIAAGMGSNFHVDLSFQVSEIADTLRIPVGALFRNGESWAVYLAESGRARLAPVEILGRNAQLAAIKSGLKEGQRVIVYPGDLVKEGSRVKEMP